MEKIFYLDYALNGRKKGLKELLEKDGKLDESIIPPDMKAYFNRRQLFYDCDFAISSLTVESDVCSVRDPIKSLMEIWNTEDTTEVSIHEFWEYFEQLLFILFRRQSTEDDTIQKLYREFRDDDKEVSRFMIDFNAYKDKNVSEEMENKLFHETIRRLTMNIFYLEMNILGENIVFRYLSELDKKKAQPVIQEREIPLNVSNEETESTDASDSSESEENLTLESNVKYTSSRMRRLWTDEEVKALIKGVRKFGEGSWRLIQVNYLPGRTNVMIKDKVRTMKSSKDPAIKRIIYKSIHHFEKKHKQWIVCYFLSEYDYNEGNEFRIEKDISNFFNEGKRGKQVSR